MPDYYLAGHKTKWRINLDSFIPLKACNEIEKKKQRSKIECKGHLNIWQKIRIARDKIIIWFLTLDLKTRPSMWLLGWLTMKDRRVQNTSHGIRFFACLRSWKHRLDNDWKETNGWSENKWEITQVQKQKIWRRKRERKEKKNILGSHKALMVWSEDMHIVGHTNDMKHQLTWWSTHVKEIGNESPNGYVCTEEGSILLLPRSLRFPLLLKIFLGRCLVVLIIHII